MKLAAFILLFLLNGNIVTDIRNNEVDLSKKYDKAYVIFMSGWSCADCFKSLSKAIKLIDREAVIVLVVRGEKSIISRKETIERARKLLDFNDYYFDIVIGKDTYPPKNPKGGLFEKHNIQITPALLYLDGGKQVFISYDHLFNNKDTKRDLAGYIKNRIK